jgi:hypothetical protein
MLKQICQFNFGPCLCSKCAWVRKQPSSFCTHSILKFFQTYCLMALANVLSVLRFTASDYPFGIFRMFSLYCLPFDLRLRILITPFVSLNYWLSLDLWLLINTTLSSSNYWPLYCLFLDSDYPFRIFKLLSVLRFMAAD